MNTNSTRIVLGVLILIATGIALWFILVQPTPVSAPGVPSVTGAKVNEPVVVEDHGLYYDITASYPATTPLKTNASVDAKIVVTLKTFVEEQTAAFKQNSGLDTLTPEDIAIQGLGVDRKYALDIDFTPYSSPNTLTYVFTIYEDTLGAHPNGYYRTFTFDSKTGTELQIGDLFTDTSYLETLSQLSREDLKATLGSDVDVEYLESGTTPTTESFQTFYLDSGALVLIFPPYQVGPWAIGTQTVTIPVAALTALKPEYR